MLDWLLADGLGPAAVSLPVTWTANALAGAAERWFRRVRRTDDLSRLVKAAAGSSVNLSPAEFDAVRRRLEDQETWTALGSGTVEDLADLIAGCLAPGDRWTSENAHNAALAIARGLIEFAIADLDPQLFQRVLLARLNRLERNQVSALDQALFDLHADLMARFTEVTGRLKEVLDRLPPGLADRAEIGIYLRALAEWLNSDSWPRDRRFGGPALTPAAVERKLRVSSKRERDLDADDLASQCRRLVLLGGPGSGKTWLAKRTARRGAERALEELAAGARLDEIELPLYTTCARLASASGDIRAAVVSSALDQLGELGGSRLVGALHAFFTERNAPTLLVIDSLDEARGADDPLRRVSSLRWRVVLTSRPSAWNNQLSLDEGTDGDRVAALQPLRYPSDVETLIERWFSERPEPANNLVAQIAARPGLQQAASVPLILACYCILGGDQPLPDFRRDLYAKVLNRLLTGRWRGGSDSQPDLAACLGTLQAWAWLGATSDPVSGTGTWTDDIPTDMPRLDKADREALDNVAPPAGPADIDTWTVLRLFVHRSLREHLVAEHVAGLSVDEASEILLSHLWYDPDWEYAVPAALARHPQRDRIARDLIGRAAKANSMPAGLAAIDAGSEFRKLLTRAAAESNETDWSPEIAGLIGKARVELAQSAGLAGLGASVHWTASSRDARTAQIHLLAGLTDGAPASALLDDLAELGPTPEDKQQCRAVLLRLLASPDNTRLADQLAGRLEGLDPTPGQKCQARETLLGLLDEPDGWWFARALVTGIIRLDPTPEDRQRIGGILARKLADQAGEDEEKAIDALVQIARVMDSNQQARELLLGELEAQAGASTVARLADAVIEFGPTPDDKRRLRAALVQELACSAVLHKGAAAGEGLLAADCLARLADTADSRHEAHVEVHRFLAGQADQWMAAPLLHEIVHLAQTPEERREARDTLLGFLGDRADRRLAAGLVGGLTALAATPEEKREVRGALLALLSDADAFVAAELAGGLAELDPVPEDSREACQVLLRLLPSPDNTWLVAVLADRLVRLHPAPEQQDQARQILLGLLAHQTDSRFAAAVAFGLNRLDLTPEEKRQIRAALLTWLTGRDDGRGTSDLVTQLIDLDPTAEDKRRAREALLASLTAADSSNAAIRAADGVILLDPTAEDKDRARRVLLAFLTSQSDNTHAQLLMNRLVPLSPTARDLSSWREWPVPPTEGLLAATRRNSTLADWLDVLPQLAPLSG